MTLGSKKLLLNKGKKRKRQRVIPYITKVLLSKQISLSLVEEMFLYQPKFSSSCPLGVISNFSSSHRQACEGLSLFKSYKHDRHMFVNIKSLISGFLKPFNLLDDSIGCWRWLGISIIDRAFHLVNLMLLCPSSSSSPTWCSSRLHRASELSVLVGQAQNHRILRPGSAHI